jgi:hypothetical protein
MYYSKKIRQLRYGISSGKLSVRRKSANYILLSPLLPAEGYLFNSSLSYLSLSSPGTAGNNNTGLFSDRKIERKSRQGYS